MLLALVLHPLVNLLQVVVNTVYPLNEEVGGAELVCSTVRAALGSCSWCWPCCRPCARSWPFAVSSFRAFAAWAQWTAIILSSILFGATHSIFQQSLITCLVGIVIGFLAIQSGSLWPGVLFHVTHNALGLFVHGATESLADEHHWCTG